MILTDYIFTRNFIFLFFSSMDSPESSADLLPAFPPFFSANLFKLKPLRGLVKCFALQLRPAEIAIPRDRD